MAQATIINIGKSNSTPADAEVAARKLKFASAFQGMESDICDLLQMARLVQLSFESHLFGGLDHTHTDEDGRQYFVVAMDDISMIQFAGLELCNRVKNLHAAYNNVFATA